MFRYCERPDRMRNEWSPTPEGQTEREQKPRQLAGLGGRPERANIREVLQQREEESERTEPAEDDSEPGTSRKLQTDRRKKDKVTTA